MLAIVLCIVVVGTVVGVLFTNNNEANRLREQDSIEASKVKTVDFDTTVEWNEKYRLYVMYPLTGQSQIDKTARAKIDKYVNEFRKQVDQKKPDTNPYELNIIGSVNVASKTVINFLYTGKWYLGGTDKGTVVLNALFDRTTGKEIRTSDLFKDNTYLQTASTTARQALPGILGTQSYNKALVEQGTTPTATHFDNFEIVNDKTINIIFEPGQVASPALGMVKVPLGLDSLQDDLNQDIVGKMFPDYIAQVQAAEKKKAEQEAAAQRQAQEAAAGRGAQPLPANGNVDCNQAKCIALTFDDGPGPGTETILDTLKQYNARATFMVVGSRVAGWAPMLQREVAEGHDIGNHTWDHGDLTNMSIADAQSEVNRTQQAVIEVTGKRPFMVRPPYGSYNAAVLNAIGLPFILWSVDPNDWKDRDADIVYQRVMAAAKPGAIVLSHDLYPTTAQAYQRIIPDLISQGYTLVTVSNLLGIDPANPPVQAFSSR